MTASQISFASFAASLLASAQQEFDFPEAECTPPVQQAAVEVVAHPLAVDDGECSDWAGPVLSRLELVGLAFATTAAHGDYYSNGAFVLLGQSNLMAALEYGRNSDAVASYDRLLAHAGHAIGAGC